MSKKLCIIAGAGPGNGQALAKRFSQGYDVLLLARNGERLSQFAQEITAGGAGKAIPLPVDLSDFEMLRTTLDDAISREGVPSVLIYNAVAWTPRDARTMTAEDVMDDLRLGVASAQACVEVVYPRMKKEGRGSILFTGGGVALYPQYGVSVPAAAAAKAGLRSLAYVLHETAKDDGIRVATITIAGEVASGTAFDPSIIAETFWRMHEAPVDEACEYIFDGAQK